MSKSALSLGIGGAMAAIATLAAPAAHADAPGPHYRYVAIDQAQLPAPYTSFNPTTVVNGRVFGTVFDDSFTIGAVAEYRNGNITIGPAGSATTARGDGLIGGSSLSGQAALFRGDDTTLVSPLSGQIFGSVIGLGAAGLSLVSSTSSSFVTTFAYLRRGAETVIDFGLPDPVFGASMNDAGFIGITKEESANDHFLHGYRYDPFTQTTTLLPKFAGDPTDINVLIQGINDRNEVLGYSFSDFTSPSYHERVGVWDPFSNTFHPFFEETINTQTLLFNNFDQIVITNSSDTHSYLVPRPGTRLDLASITTNVPAGLGLVQAVSIDDQGNIAGFSADATLTNFFPFLLVPMRDGDDDGGEVHVRHCVPWAVAHAQDRWHSHK